MEQRKKIRGRIDVVDRAAGNAARVDFGDDGRMLCRVCRRDEFAAVPAFAFVEKMQDAVALSDNVGMFLDEKIVLL